MHLRLHQSAGAIALASGLLAAPAALADITLYEDDFEQGPLSELWTESSQLTTNRHLSTFNGRHSRTAISLVIPLDKRFGGAGKDSGSTGGEPGGGGGGTGGNGGGGGDNGGGGDDSGGTGGRPTGFWLEFDLYIIDSWDGVPGFGEDFFEVAINQNVEFRESFDNHGGPQSYRQPDQRGQYGYNFVHLDSVYRDIRIDFELADDAENITIDFRGIDLQGFMDESFGIDNVSVGYVPAPGATALGLLAMGSFARRRR